MYNSILINSAVLIEKKGNYVILLNREEGTWIRISARVYDDICRHIESNADFELKYNKLLNALNDLRILDYNTTKRQLENVTVMLTNKCNLSCKHCCASEIIQSKDISIEILRKIIKLKPRQITITGGEPLLHKNIEKILMVLRKEYNGILVLATNGILIEKHLDLVINYIDKVEISLDGVEEKETAKYRGSGVFHRVLDAVKMLRRQGVTVAMSLVTYNGMEEKRFFQLNQSYGTVPIVRELFLNDRVLENIDSIVPEGKEGYIQIVKKNIEQENENVELSKCGAFSYQIFVDSEGYIYPCGGLAEESLKYGNIQTQEVLEDIINYPELCYKKVCNKLLLQNKFARCRECIVRIFCWNCLSNILSKSMITEVFEEYCKNSRKKWMDFIWKDGGDE